MYKFRWNSSPRDNRGMEIYEFLDDTENQPEKKIYVRVMDVKRKLLKLIAQSYCGLETTNILENDQNLIHHYKCGSQLSTRYCYINNCPCIEFEYLSVNNTVFFNYLNEITKDVFTYRDQNEYHINPRW